MSVDDKTILITGGTGTFGRALVEAVLTEHKPRKVIVFSRDELKQSEMRKDFPDGHDSIVRYFIGDIRDPKRLQRAFHDVDIVIHAAALKQVDACEYNPFEAVQTNVVGTQNIIDAAIDQKVEKVLTVSTDKAVNPANLYGATKLCAEKLMVQGNAYSSRKSARFAAARYGNVVGSRGSVVPIFQNQRKSGRLTVTDESMTRFWITPKESVRFVLRCLDLMNGAEIFIPKIPSIRIMDLAAAMAPDCEVDFIGIGPGEKIHEILLSLEEARYALETDDMFVIQTNSNSDATPHERQPVPPGFVYSSDSNDHWLSMEDLRAMLLAEGIDA